MNRVQSLLKTMIVVLIATGILAGTLPLDMTPPARAAGIFIYTALGDSLGFGALAPPFQGYTFLYRRAVALDTAHSVWLANLGIPGWTSSDLLDALRSSPYFRSAVRNSQIVTWNIGGNDLRAGRTSYKRGTCGGFDNQDCLRAGVTQLKLNWDGILVELARLLNFDRTIVRTTDFYNPYVSEDLQTDSWPNDGGNDFQVLKFYLDDVNHYIVTKSANAGIPCALVYDAFNGASGEEDPRAKGYIAFDGLHANATGHAVIAQRLRDLGYAPLH